MTHLLSVLTILYAEWQVKTVIFAVIYYGFCAFGITGGYHRMYSHKAYEGNGIWQVITLLAGTGALQGSCLWWAILHRAHHRWTDTEKDPYNSKRGFFYAHIGWLFYKTIRIDTNVVYVEDLKNNKYVRWQNKHFKILGPFVTFVLPTIIAYLGWGDLKGGFLIAGVLKAVLLQHATWCVNSLAHYSFTNAIMSCISRKPFDHTLTPVDSILTALITMGEGYHNFHHEYPNDYRNAIAWYQWDPTKWSIKLASYLGLTKNLNAFSNNEIQRAMIDMEQRELDEKKKKIDYGNNVEELPIMTKKNIQEMAGNKTVCIIHGIVHDVTEFIPKHPGGDSLLRKYSDLSAKLGKDFGNLFDGGLYNHSNAARNMMSHMRIGKTEEFEDEFKSKVVSMKIKRNIDVNIMKD